MNTGSGRLQTVWAIFFPLLKARNRALVSALLLLWFGFPPVAAEASYCEAILARIFTNGSSALLLKSKTEFPEIETVYSPRVLRKGIKEYKNFEKRYARNASLTHVEKLQPFWDIAEFTDKLSHGVEPSIEDFGKRILHWPNREEIIPYLYSQMSDLYPLEIPLLKWLMKNDPLFEGALWTHKNHPSLVTFSFEKETHNPEITDWYRLPKYTDYEWFQMAPEKRMELLQETKGNTLVATRLRPNYLGVGETEHEMRHHDNRFNRGKPPVETKHFAFEINPNRIFHQMREVQNKLNEGSAFHVHIVFPFPKNNPESFKALASFWKRLNDYLYLKGLENGMHPSALTQLPEEANIPTQWSDLSGSKSKYFGAGLRTGIYGESTVPNHDLVGIELRDSTHSVLEWEFLTKNIARWVHEKKWMSQPAKPAARLFADSAKLKKDFWDEISRAGIRGTTIATIIAVDPLLTIPMENFESMDGSTSENWGKSRETYLSKIVGTAKEFEKYKNAQENVEDDILRSALRLSLSEWAKETRPSELFDPLH